MNLINLRKSVLNLIFSDAFESEEAFINATNRAIMRARINFPKKKTKKIAQYPLKNMLGERNFFQYTVKGEKVFYGDDLTSYSFYALGKGNFTVYYFNNSIAVNDYEELFTVEIDSPNHFSNYKGFVKRFNNFTLGRFKVVFSGDYQFTIKNVALYDSLISPSESEIPPFAEYVTYDLKELTKEYGSEYGVSKNREVFVNLLSPITLNDNFVKTEIDYKLDDGILQVPREVMGEIEITYSALPETIGVESGDNTIIDLPDIIAEVISYLIASNLIIEEEAELSKYYLNLYKEAESYANSLYDIGNMKYISTCQWC